MHIDDYSFGRLTLDGRLYESDLMVCGEELHPNWWRKEGHHLHLDDLTWLLERHPDILIIGKGNVGCMTVPADVLEYLTQRQIETHVANTGPAVQMYNRTVAESNGVVGATFHLTC